MRLFIAISLPPALTAYCQQMQAHFPGMKNTETFHLTLQFLGDDIPEERVPAIRDKLSQISFTPFPVTLGDAVPFGHPKRPDGVWIDCRGGAPLHQFAEKVRSAMGNLGYLPDKPFAAHITLGRYKNGPPAVPKPVAGEPREFTVSHFCLMQSRLGVDGPKYKILATFPAA